MGATSSKITDCGASQLACALGEPQEVCHYGTPAVMGFRPGAPCDWGNLSALCTSTLTGCECAELWTAGFEKSALPIYFESPTSIGIYAGPAMLWILTLLVYPLYRMLSHWSRSRKLPRSLTTFVSSTAIQTWMALCVFCTAALVALSYSLPANVWGDCANRGVCVYHMMFCEATRHHSAVRHPANFWSNLPYLYMALGMLCVAIDARRRRSPRPYQLLDASFAVVLLGMCLASFAWHGSNCTAIHFVDIALMNCVMAYFPYRFIAASLIVASGKNEAQFSLAIALGFWAIVGQQALWAADQTPQFHGAFPTGYSRLLSVTHVEIALYVGLPGLYPLPVLARMAQRKTWGCVPALVVSVLALPIGFCFHAAERLVMDVYCSPWSVLSQPTATFHVCTALAIAGGYVQAHALEES